MSALLLKGFAFLAFSETWLASSIPDSLVLQKESVNYSIHRCDRNGRGGGVALIVHTSISSTLASKESVKDSHEIIAVDLIVSGDVFRIIVVYRTPKSPDALSTRLFSAIADLASCAHPVVITGDFNLRDLKWQMADRLNTSISRISSDFLSLCSSLQLEQLVARPTRGENILDLVLSNQQGLIENVVIGPPFGQSDHASVSCDIQLEHCFPAFIWRRNYSKADFTTINGVLASVDWETTFACCSSIDEMYEFLLSCIQGTIDNFVPLERVSVQHGKLPDHLQRLLRSRFAAWQRSIESNTESDRKAFTGINLKCKKELNKHHRHIEKEVVERLESFLQTREDCYF